MDKDYILAEIRKKIVSKSFNDWDKDGEHYDSSINLINVSIYIIPQPDGTDYFMANVNHCFEVPDEDDMLRAYYFRIKQHFDVQKEIKENNDLIEIYNKICNG